MIKEIKIIQIKTNQDLRCIIKMINKYVKETLWAKLSPILQDPKLLLKQLYNKQIIIKSKKYK